MESSAGQNDLWIFRDGHKTVPGTQLLDALRTAVHQLSSVHANCDSSLNALIRAGEMEAALSDAACASSRQIGALTDALANALYGNSQLLSNKAFDLDVDVPPQLTISPPEGFSYYALHPLDFGRLAQRVGTGGKPAAVIGIRSIGTTLSAVVTAALSSTGVPAERITVRPTGHPYDRVLRFTPAECSWIAQRQSEESAFLVVDEGPGRSGSTFLSVAEALVAIGVDMQRITLLGSRQPDMGQLCSRQAAERWNRFRFAAVEPDLHSRFKDYAYIGGGDWRELLLPQSAERPTCWPQMERLKFLSPDGRRFWKFEGMGRYGEEAQLRSRCLADAGYGVPIEDGGGGFISCQVIDGSSLQVADVSTSLLEHVANYCAFRASEFRLSSSSKDPLAKMLIFNVQQEFGIDLKMPTEEFESGATVLTDGRMQPHEWILARTGQVFKVDACAHGNDHFFPGPCDIAWDLAGFVEEWNLHADAIQHLLSRFRQLTGDNVRRRFPLFALTYKVFRLGWCKMAMPSVAGSSEEFRIRREYCRYRERVEIQLAQAQPKLTRSQLIGESLPA